MPKMMMGQIDHARSRVRQIKNEKRGDAPVAIKRKEWSDVIALIIADPGTTVLTSAVVRKAVILTDARDKEYRKRSTYYYANNAPSFETCVAEVLFGKEYNAALKIYDAEYELYKQRASRIDAEATKVEDAIVLGDQQAALAALTAFAEFTV